MPEDPTPLGDAMSHRFEEQKIPQPKNKERSTAADTSIDSRPGLPETPREMPADVMDADDPSLPDKQKG
jgi:hypothetical protein